MKVLLVSSNSGSRGGGEIYLRNLAAGLGQLGCDVHALISTAAKMDELSCSLSKVSTVHRLPLIGTYDRLGRSLTAAADFRQRNGVRRFINRLSPDVTHINQQVAEDGLDLVLAARSSRHASVSTIHITQSARQLSARCAGPRDFITKRVLQHSQSRIIAVSNVTANRLIERFPALNPESVSLVYYGVANQDEESYRASRVRARLDWRVGENELVVGNVGRIEHQKNPLFLLDVFASLIHAGIRAKLVWIGDGSLRGSLEEHARARDIADCLIIDGWREDAGSRMAGLDVLAMPSLYEGLPLAVLEAMHAGLVVCASNADGIPEAIADGDNGIVLSRAVPDRWRDAIAYLAKDADRRKMLGIRAREMARVRFSIESMARATLAVYEQAIARC